MVTYNFVREAKESRQKESENIHILRKDAKRTVCNNYVSEELTAIRNVPIGGSGNFCDECQEKRIEFLQI